MSSARTQLVPQQFLNTSLTTWHITWGTYAARLHGGFRPTVDRWHNQIGEEFIGRDPERERIELESLRGEVVYLSNAQQLVIQELIPTLCVEGGWTLRTCSASHDHVHVVLDIDPTIHGERVRRLLKREIGIALSRQCGKPSSGTWWAKEGSNKAIHDAEYLNNAVDYVFRQRAETVRNDGDA